MNKTISTVGMSREEWLEIRRGSIGGSDAAAIVGLSKWSSPYSVWAEKTGRTVEKEDSEAMRLGRDLEAYVALRWCEATGKQVRRKNAIIYNEAYPFAHANLDRVVVGEHAVLECKTTGTLDMKKFRDTDFPEQYYAQCVHYLAVTGADRCYLAVLQFGKGFYTYELERDEDEIHALMEAESAFWKCVESDTAPEADGAPATTETIGAIYPQSCDGCVDLLGREKLFTERKELKAQADEIARRIDEIDNTIKSDLGEIERGQVGDWSVSWKTQTRSTFQTKQFVKDHPDMDLSGYYKESQSRVFKVTERSA